MGCGPLKEGREEPATKIIFHGLERRPYVWGHALHKSPLLLEEILQDCVGSLWVPARHHSHDGH